MDPSQDRPNLDDSGALISYLRDHNLVGPEEAAEVVPLAGGVSNRTFLITRPHGGDFVLKQALPKLRVQADWFSDPARIHREALGLRRLPAITPPGTITPLLFEDPVAHVIAMEAVPRPHRNWKDMLLESGPEQRHVEAFAEIAASIHGRCEELGPEMRQEFDDRSWFESLRLEPYYRYTAEQVPAAAAFLEPLIEETLAERVGLVHGDFSPKNVLVYQDRLVLIDHEVIHYGDPAFDGGFALTHLLSKAHHCAGVRVNFLTTAATYIRQYLTAAPHQRWGSGFLRRWTRHTLACLLARVAGRSPLEYLDAGERAWQRETVLAMMADPLEHPMDLIDEWGRRLQCR